MAEFLCTAVISPPYPLAPEQIARAKAIAARAINGSDGPQEGNEPDKPKEPDGSLKRDGLEADSDRSVTCNFESGFPCGRIDSGGLGIEGSIRSSEGAEEEERERDDIVFQMFDLNAGFWKGLSTTSLANDHDSIFMFGNPANTDMSAHACEAPESRDADGAQPSDHASSAVAGAGSEGEGETIVDFQENKWWQGSGTGTNLAVVPSATQALPGIVGPLRSGLSRGIVEEGGGGERGGNFEDVKFPGLDSGPGPPHTFIGDDKNSITKTMANASADFVKPDSDIQTVSRQSHDSSNCIVPVTTDTTEIPRTATTLAAPAAHVNINGTDVVDPARRSRSNAKEEASTENAHQSTDADYSDKNHEGAATFVTSSTLFAAAANAFDAFIASSSTSSGDLLSLPTKPELNNILVPSRRLPGAFLHSSSSGREQLLSGSSGTTTSARTGAVPLQSQKHTHLQQLQLQLPSDSRNQQRQKGPQSPAETLPEIITTTASAVGSSFSERIEHLQNHVAASSIADHQQPPTQVTQSFCPIYQTPFHGNLASDCPSRTSGSSPSPSQTLSSLIPPPDIPPRSSSRLRTQSIGRPYLRHRLTTSNHHRSASAGSSSSNTKSATTARLEDSTSLTKTAVSSYGGPLSTQAAQGAEQQVHIGPEVQSQLESQESSHLQQQQYYSHSPRELEADTARLDHRFYFQQLSTATSTKASSRTFGFSFGKSRSRSNSATTEPPSVVVDPASGSGFEVLSTETRGRPQTRPAPGIDAKDREALEQESRNIPLEHPLPVSTSVRATSSHIPSSSGSFFSQLTASRDRLLPASWHRDRDHSRAREHPREHLDEPTGLVPFYFPNNHESRANESLQDPTLLPSPLLKGDQTLTSHKFHGKALSQRLYSESSTALPSPTRSGFSGSNQAPARTGRSVSLTSAQPKLAPGSSSGHAPSLSLSVKPAPQGAVPPLPPLLLGNFAGFPAASAALSGATAPLVISPPISPPPTATLHNNHARSKSRSKSKFDKSKSNPASPRSPSSSTFSFHLHSPPHPNTPKKRNLWLPSRGRPSLETSLSPTLLSGLNRGINVSPRRQTFSLEHTSGHTQITSSSDMDTPKLSGKLSSAFGPRPDASTLSVASKTSTMSSQNSASASSDALLSKPFVLKNGRTFINDSTLPYPLPVDLTELHRESLRTLFLIQLFRVPVCCPSLSTKPPTKVLEVGCGSGFWSMMCHRYFRNRGHPGISFTGLDISPLAPSSTSGLRRPDQDMKWRFVQHDLRVTPLPFPDGEFDLIMVKDMSLAVTNGNSQRLMDEYIRLLTPGGVLEIWESDHTIRMLRPQNGTPEDDGEKEPAIALGAYVMTPNTPLSSALNRYIVEYNAWITKFLDSKDLSAVPCTFISPNLLQESEALCDVKSRRLAVPLSDVRWEKEGIGGVLATGKSSKRRSKPPGLSPGQLALRQTALLTVVQKIQGLEDALRKVSGKSQDEWDIWMGKMMKDLLQDNGTSWGECLEIGAWWATKRE